MVTDRRRRRPAGFRILGAYQAAPNHCKINDLQIYNKTKDLKSFRIIDFRKIPEGGLDIVSRLLDSAANRLLSASVRQPLCLRSGGLVGLVFAALTEPRGRSIIPRQPAV